MSAQTPVTMATSPPPSPARRRPSTPRMVLLGLVILICGMIIGSAATLFVARRAVIHAVLHPEDIPARASERLARRLDLTDEQRAEVESILRRRLQALARVREHFRPQIDRELDHLRDDVAAVLDAEQERQWRDDFRRLRRLIQPPPTAETSPPPAEPPTGQ